MIYRNWFVLIFPITLFAIIWQTIRTSFSLPLSIRPKVKLALETVSLHFEYTYPFLPAFHHNLLLQHWFQHFYLVPPANLYFIVKSSESIPQEKPISKRELIFNERFHYFNELFKPNASLFRHFQPFGL